MMLTVKTASCVLVLLAVLAACGGGGSDEEPTAGVQPVQCSASGICK